MSIDPRSCAHFREIERALRTVRFVDEPAYIPSGPDSSDSSDAEPEAGPSRLPDLQRPEPANAGPSGAPQPPAPRPRPQAPSAQTLPPPAHPQPAAVVRAPQPRADSWAPPVPPRPRPYPSAAVNPPSPPRQVPMVRPVAQAARRPIESASLATNVSQAGDTSTPPASSQGRPLPQAPQLGHWAVAATHVLQPSAPTPMPDRLKGRLQATLDALLPSNRRYKNDSLHLAAWLRDNGVVALDASGRDYVLNAHSAGSDRLERLGIRQAFPNLSTRHVTAVREALADRYAQQLEASWNEQPEEAGLTEVVREALPKAGRKAKR